MNGGLGQGSSKGQGRRETIRGRESQTGQQSLKAAGNLVTAWLPTLHVSDISHMHSLAAQGTWSSWVLSQQEAFFIHSPTQASFPEGPARTGGHFQRAESICDDLQSSKLHGQSKLSSPWPLRPLKGCNHAKEGVLCLSVALDLRTYTQTDKEKEGHSHDSITSHYQVRHGHTGPALCEAEAVPGGWGFLPGAAQYTAKPPPPKALASPRPQFTSSPELLPEY